ncbi:unnamed protein product [Microthlaspi erraticum]|uniref:Uncharacterized protein n=1 Tax=Microthlaspi erraticum TaxID=1685480 RepID=A0A6D2J642_9BRAS|nr:unnamed protein product [Microthlaspi erraticum]
MPKPLTPKALEITGSGWWSALSPAPVLISSQRFVSDLGAKGLRVAVKGWSARLCIESSGASPLQLCLGQDSLVEHGLNTHKFCISTMSCISRFKPPRNRDIVASRSSITLARKSITSIS